MDEFKNTLASRLGLIKPTPLSQPDTSIAPALSERFKSLAPVQKSYASLSQPAPDFKAEATANASALPDLGKQILSRVGNIAGHLLLPTITDAELSSPQFLANTIKGLPGAVLDTATGVVTHPIASAEGLVGGIARGISNSVTDILLNNFVSAQHRDAVRTEVQATLDKYLTPPASPLTEGATIGGSATPVIAAGVAGGGLAGAGATALRLGGFATKAAVLGGEAAGFVGAGQASLPSETDINTRANQALNDLVALGLFKVGDAAYRAAKPVVQTAVSNAAKISAKAYADFQALPPAQRNGGYIRLPDFGGNVAKTEPIAKKEALTPKTAETAPEVQALPDKARKDFTDTLAKSEEINVYLPREQGTTLFQDTPVKLVEPKADNILTEGKQAWRFKVNKSDISIDPKTGQAVYTSPEIREATYGKANVKPVEQTTLDIPKELASIEATKKFSATQLEELRTVLGIMKEAIDTHPANGLQKYESRQFPGDLPEVTGRPTRKSPTSGRTIKNTLFGRSGDVLVMDRFGFENLDTAQASLDSFHTLKDQFASALADLRQKATSARDFKQLDNARKQLLSLAKRAQETSKTVQLETLRNKIRFEIANARAKVDKQGILKGKYTPEIQAKLTSIERAINTHPADASNTILSNIERYSGPEGSSLDMPDEVKAENDLLSMAGALDALESRKMGAEALQRVIDTIQSIKQTGQTLRELKDFNKATEIQRQQTKAVDIMTGGQGLKPGTYITPEPDEGWIKARIGQPLNSFMDVHRGLNAILEYLSRFDSSSTPWNSFLNRQFGFRVDAARNMQSKGVRQGEEMAQGKFGEIFGVKPGTKEFRTAFRDQLKVETISTATDAATGNPIELKMNKFQLRKKWMELQDPSLDKTFHDTMGWNEATIRDVNLAMTPQDRAFALWQLKEFYPAYYKTINPVYEEMTGASLPFRDNYSPIRRRVINDQPEYIQWAKDMLQRASAKPGGIKSRIQNIQPLEFTGDFQTLQRHIIEMEHFKAYTEVLTDLRRIFSSTAREAIRQYHGKPIVADLDKVLNDLARDGVDWRNRFEFLDTARGNVATAFLGLNVLQVPKQLSGAIAYLSEPGIGVTEYFKAQADFFKNPAAIGRDLISSSEYLKARYDLGDFDRDVKLALSKESAGALQGKASWRETLMLFTKLGDRLTALVGGYPIYKINYDRQIATGAMPEAAKAEAIRAFEHSTKRTQGSGNVEDLGSVQRSGSIGNLFSLFRNNPIAMWQVAEAAARNLGLFEKWGGSVQRGARMDNLKSLFVMWVLVPSIFQWVSDGGTWQKKRQLEAAVLGPMGYPLIVGDLLAYLAQKATGQQPFSDSFTPAGLSALYNLSKPLIDVVTLENIFKTMNDFAVYGGAFAGIPVGTAERYLGIASDSSGIKIKGGALGVGADILKGKMPDLRQLIYSPYALGQTGTKKTTSSATMPLIKIPALEKLKTLGPGQIKIPALERLKNIMPKNLVR